MGASEQTLSQSLLERQAFELHDSVQGKYLAGKEEELRGLS